MLRIIFVLVILGTFEYHKSSGHLTEADDWRKKRFYRPRRNYPSQSQSINSFQSSQNQQNQNAFSLKYSQSFTGASNTQNYESQNPFGISSQNTQMKNDFSAGYSQTPNAFGFKSRNFGASSASQSSFGQNRDQAFGSNFNNQNAFQKQNVTSSQFSSNFGSNSAFTKGQNYKASGSLLPFRGPEYLPPTKPRTTFPPYIPPQSTTTKIPFFTTTTTRRPFFTTTTTQRPTTNTQRIFTVSLRKPAMAMEVPPETEEDDYGGYYDDYDYERTGQVAPAMAMKVPPESGHDDELVNDYTITKLVPVASMAIIVPPEPEYSDDEPIDDLRTTTKKPISLFPLPATAMPVPHQEGGWIIYSITSDDEGDTTPSTTFSTTTSTTSSTTTSTTPSTSTTSTTPPTTTSTTTPTTTTTTTPSTTTSTTTTSSTSTPDFNRNQESKPTTPTTTLHTTPSDNPFQAPPYLPPRIPTSVPSKPAMALVVSPEPLDASSYPSDNHND